MSEETTKSYKYRAFGLKIQSEFEIPEFLPAQFEEPQVNISLGKVPDFIQDAEKKGVRYQLNKKEFLLHLDYIAGYYVQEGKSIKIQQVTGSTMQEVRLFLVGIVFAALLQQRSVFALHASALQKGGGCFLIAGNSGAGKSTLTHEFLNAGYRLLSDDISVLEQTKDKINVQPAFPFIKLWEDSMEHLELNKMEGIKLREQMDKYGFSLEGAFYPEALPVKRIFILSPHNQPKYTSETLKGIDKFNALKNHTYRFQFIANQLRTSHFELINTMASRIPVYRVNRPQAPINTSALKKFIEDLLEAHE